MDVEFIAKTIYIQSSDGNNIPQIYELQMENKENESKRMFTVIIINLFEIYKSPSEQYFMKLNSFSLLSSCRKELYINIRTFC